MAIRLTKEALEYYVLTCLSIQEMYGAQILKSVNENVSITSTALYEILASLEKDGRITRKTTVKNGVSCDLCSITPLGQYHLDVFLKTR